MICSASVTATAGVNLVRFGLVQFCNIIFGGFWRRKQHSLRLSKEFGPSSNMQIGFLYPQIQNKSKPLQMRF